MMDPRQMTDPKLTWTDRWTAALSDGLFADTTHCEAGARLAQGAKVAIEEIGSGLVQGIVGGERAQVGFRQLTVGQWDRVLDVVSTDARLVAQFLAGRLPSAISELVLPTAGDVTADCSCSDWIEPCRHAAGLAHAVGLLFGDDPFALLLLRGRGRNDLIAEVRSRRARALGVTLHDAVGHPRGVDPGVSAAASWRRNPTPLPAPMRLPPEPGSLRHLGVAPPAGSGVEIAELRELVTDAAARAHAMLAEGSSSELGLAVGPDVARRAVTGDVERISAATRLPVDELKRAAIAWQFGGTAALTASRQLTPAEATSADMAAGVEALGPSSRVRGNTVSLGPVQLRRDQDGRWWRMEADEVLGWILTAPGANDPADLVE